MSARDKGALLHNMSAPPHTVVKYTGLDGLATTQGPGGSGVAGIKFKGTQVFGTPVRFVLPAALSGLSPASILRQLGIEGECGPDAQPARQLAALVDRRADELALPDACVAIAAEEHHRVIWPDALAALAIFSKCSGSVWLRAKSPALAFAVRQTQLSLLVPPRLAHRLPEATS